MQKQVAKLVLENKRGKILLLRRGATAPSRANQWDLPGGFVEHGEDAMSGLKREVSEETGLKLTKLRYIGSAVTPSLHRWLYFYRQINKDFEIKLSWEHTEYIWQPKSSVARNKELARFIKRDLAKLLDL